MLSMEDIIKEIGVNIFIYPMKDMRIHGNSVDLTASKYAWTSDGKYIYDEKTDQIVIPPNKTACILTQEAIYVTEKIGGTYHSRVGLAVKGFGHIGTMLDPKYFGQSLIMLHNISDKVIRIKSRDRVVSLIFYYLKTPILTLSHTSSPGHRDKLASFERYDEYEQWFNQNRWAVEQRELVNHFKQSQDYIEFLKRRETDSKQWGKKLGYYLKKLWLKYVIIIVACIGMDAFCTFVLKFDQSVIASLISGEIAVLLGMIVRDIDKK